MNESRFAIRVGLFVAVGLVLLAALLLSFSKGLSFFTPTFKMSMEARSVGGLKKNANVLLSGVPVGKVTGFDVTADGKGVLITLSIEQRYHDRIRSDARFSIQQLGLLGDQYVDITPLENKAPTIKSGQIVQAQEPLSLQETARSAKDLLALATQTLTSLNQIMARIDKTVLSERSLGDFSLTMADLRGVAIQASNTLNSMNGLIVTNSPAIYMSVSNLAQFSQDMGKLSLEMNQLVATNRVELTKAVQNLENSSRALNRLATDVDAGKGFAGMLVRDEVFRQNMSNAASNLVNFSRSLNERSLFRNFFSKPKPPPKQANK